MPPSDCNERFVRHNQRERQSIDNLIMYTNSSRVTVVTTELSPQRHVHSSLFQRRDHRETSTAGNDNIAFQTHTACE